MEVSIEPDREYSHDEQFLLKDAKGNPLKNAYYTAKIPDGELIYGVTSAEGKTERFTTDGAKKIQIHIGHLA